MRKVELRYCCPCHEETVDGVEGVADGAKAASREVNIVLSVDMQIGIGGDTWPAAELFCHFLLDSRWFSFFSELFRGKTVLELGSGHALVSILVDKVFDVQEVVVTDLSEYIDLLNMNIVDNACTRTRAEAIDWTTVDHPQNSAQTFDVILALECVYRRELFLPLIRTLEKKSHASKSTVIILGITRDFANEYFFTLLLQHGYKYRKLPQSAFLLSDEQRQKFDVNRIGILLVYKSGVF